MSDWPPSEKESINKGDHVRLIGHPELGVGLVIDEEKHHGHYIVRLLTERTESLWSKKHCEKESEP